MNKDSCIFCKIARRELPAKIVFESPDLVAFDDINPQAPVHVVIIPRCHIEKTSDLDKGNKDLVGSMVLAAKTIAKDKKIEDTGYRIVINCNRDAGQEVFHLHLHLLGGRKFAWPPG